VWAGYGYRSSKSGVEKFARAVSAEGIDVVPLQLADPTFYHLDTCFAPLNESAALVYEPALLPSSLSMLGAGFERLHAVTQADAMSFACNGVAANGRFIASRVSPELRDILECEELTPLIADTSEFEKSGGSVFCLKNVLD
jgi:N-dimethylarginine dimethylaminohydrolase